MGQILNAVCNKCGFQKEIIFGAGMMDFQTVCNVPALNAKTGKLVIKNFFKIDKNSIDFTFYSEPTMYKGKIKNDALEWDGIYLSHQNNLCPKCQGYTMEFISCGNFD